jgi:hypothetical protein
VTYTCLSCGKGQYIEAKNSTECKSCPKGRYQENVPAAYEPGTGDKCKNCIAGKAAPDDKSVCVNCTGGKYQPDANSTTYSCLSCGIGQRALRTSCHDCVEGKYSGTAPVNYLESTCAECDAGRYAVHRGVSSCKDCPGGRYNDVAPQAYDPENSLTCKPFGETCASGKYFRAATDTEPFTCVSCSPGKYATSEGVSSCTNCPIESTMTKSRWTMIPHKQTHAKAAQMARWRQISHRAARTATLAIISLMTFQLSQCALLAGLVNSPTTRMLLHAPRAPTASIKEA